MAVVFRWNPSLFLRCIRNTQSESTSTDRHFIFIHFNNCCTSCHLRQWRWSSVPPNLFPTFPFSPLFSPETLSSVRSTLFRSKWPCLRALLAPSFTSVCSTFIILSLSDPKRIPRLSLWRSITVCFISAFTWLI